MVKKQKFLKNLLTSVSVASVVASIGGSSVAFGANIGNVNTTIAALVTAGFADNGDLTFNALDGAGDPVTLTVDAASFAIGNIGNIQVTERGNIVIERDISIGTIAGVNTTTARINAGNTLTLGGNGHTGLGITTLEGAGSKLKLKGGATINNAIITATNREGILTFEGAGTVAGDIGGANMALASVDFTGAGNVQLKGALNNALIFNINHADANVTADHDLTGSVIFGANGGTLKTPNVTGDATFGDGGGTLVGDVGGDATFGAGAGRVGNVNGNVIFGAGGGMAGNVGGRVTVGAGNASVGAVTGNVTFADAGKLTVGGGIGGNVDFAGKAGRITLAAGQAIGGNVDNTGAADNGVLLFLGAGEVTGRIGETNALKTVSFNGPGDVHLRHAANAAKATTFFFNNARANVTAYGGIEGDIQFSANGKLNLGNGKIINGAITTTKDNHGKLNFLGAGTVEGNIGANGKALNEISLQIGDVLLKGDVFAKETKLIDGSVLKLEDGKNITGAITTAADGKGTLTFNGAGKVTGNIGIAGVALAGINIGVAGGKVIKLEGNVFTKELTFVTANEVEITGNFGEVGAVGKVNFNAVGTLTFNGPVADPKIFNSTIGGGANGTLNVRGNLKAINEQIGNIGVINIGNAANAANAGNAGFLTIDASGADVILRGNGGGADQEINFLHADSVLTLYSNAAKSITFNNNLAGGVGGIAPGGVVLMHGDGNTLTLKSVGGKTLGVAGNSLRELQIRGKVTIAGDVDALDIQHIPVLNIINGAEFTDESATSAQITNVYIGATNGTGKANYIIGAKHGAVDILANGKAIHFSHAQSQLTLRNSDNANDRTIKLLNNLDPGTDNTGIVEFDSGNHNKLLKIDGAGKTLGIVAHKLKGVKFSGTGNIEVVPAIYAETITLNTTGNAEITTNGVNGDVVFATAGRLTGDVTGGVIFKANGRVTGNITGLVTVNAGNSIVDNAVANVIFSGVGQLTATQGVTGDVDFASHAGTITLGNNQSITGAIKNSDNATLEFSGDGRLTAATLNLKTLKAGAGNLNLATGNYNIKEIQGNGVLSSLTFANDFNLKGGINLSAGNAVNLIFAGNGSIDSDVGTNANPVGSIQIKAGTVTFGGAINSNNDLVIANKAMADIAKDLKAREIKGQGTVKFSNKDKIVIDSQIGNDTILEIAGADVEAVKKVSAQNIIFSSAKSATLTLKTASTINGITTTGNNFYSLALGADCSTGTNDIAANVDIKLLGDHTITINSKNFYSDILTEKNNSGKVIFKAEDSVAYGNLGADKFRLADVIFDNNSTVRADIYSKKITISADKTATFAGVEKRTIAVPTINIKGVELPRLSKEFSYYTLIDSDNIDAKPSSEIKFENAALVKAPIKDGQVTLADNVWFKGKVDSTSSVSFANKYVLLEKDIKFASIEASQAKIISLPGNQTIAGDLTAKDLTIDLGTNKLKYVGNAILTGTLQLDTFYDSLKKAGGNIEIQGKLDISQLDRLDVNITARSDSSKISKDTQYTLISLANKDDNTVIDKDKVKLVSVKEQNSFVEWSLDPTTLTLHAKNITKEELEAKLKEKEGKKDDEGKEKKETKGKIAEVKKEAKKFVIDSPNNSAQEIAFIKQLLQVEFNGDSDAAKFLSQYGSMDSKNQDLATNRLLPGNENLIGQSPMNSTAAVMTLMSQVAVAATQVAGRTATVGAGDDDKVMYGVWGSPFYSTANQKMQQGVSGYNMKSAGLIVGFDGLVNDNLLVGAAYSLINTKMSHKNQKSGDRTNGQTNIFSLYGVYKFADNWFAESIASYGITNVKNLEGRLISAESASVTALEKAVAKYKSTSYGGQLVTGYNYQASEQLTITPAIGFRYSQFMDDGHTETGTTCQNLVVKKRSYNKFEGIFGLRTAANIQLDQLLLIPEVHGYVNYDFKGKSPVIDARLGGIDKALPTKLVKPDRVFFNVGTGLTAKHNMMEYGVTYNAHIASKYIGHQGSLKIKVNF
ncbi:autotransporter domain-containing protein [Rickettsia endosymbiont of Culicoides newsteadi]|uniref:autotransporter domain-containing protein n=1 Tax=Rickettsia endosymbiont of Culicoides newsteadi TaxID=1961830 RepID=UPI000B9A9A07|nr:autotransporter outer membrane beta-barrel domain-containing protein [Rickettsia endosymbiont of Culicoides newsteadi]OZG31677.1 cell surface antigen (sca3) [Rickettsia endosymbiont of Culicoides newsteadi]